MVSVTCTYSGRSKAKTLPYPNKKYTGKNFLFLVGGMQMYTTLKKMASIIIAEAIDEMVRVEGHTDNDPTSKQKEKYKSNWELSTARAAAVLHFFREDCGIPPTRVYIAGFGQYQPIANNTSSSGKAKNRRVEFVIIPKGSGG